MSDKEDGREREGGEGECVRRVEREGGRERGRGECERRAGEVEGWEGRA